MSKNPSPIKYFKKKIDIFRLSKYRRFAAESLIPYLRTLKKSFQSTCDFILMCSHVNKRFKERALMKLTVRRAIADSVFRCPMSQKDRVKDKSNTGGTKATIASFLDASFATRIGLSISANKWLLAPRETKSVSGKGNSPKYVLKPINANVMQQARRKAKPMPTLSEFVVMVLKGILRLFRKYILAFPMPIAKKVQAINKIFLKNSNCPIPLGPRARDNKIPVKAEKITARS